MRLRRRTSRECYFSAAWMDRAAFERSSAAVCGRISLSAIGNECNPNQSPGPGGRAPTSGAATGLLQSRVADEIGSLAGELEQSRAARVRDLRGRLDRREGFTRSQAAERRSDCLDS